jgi:hypothetical protein
VYTSIEFSYFNMLLADNLSQLADCPLQLADQPSIFSKKSITLLTISSTVYSSGEA